MTIETTQTIATAKPTISDVEAGRSSARTPRGPRPSSSSTGSGCCPRAGTAGRRCSRTPGTRR